MRILNKINYYFLGGACFLGMVSLSAQETSNSAIVDSILNNFIEQKVDFEPQEAIVVINQDPRIERLSAIKTEMDKEGAFSGRYKIQLYNGSLTEANRIKNEATELFPDWKSEIIYETPDHKVHIGNFRNKLDADRALMEIRKEFPSALRFQPNKN